MKYFLIGFLFIGGMVMGAVIDFIVKSNRKEAKKGPEMAVDTDVLQGIVTDISIDPETGLTKISVKDGKGHIRYGFSTISPADLEHIYMGKGWTQVPIIKQGK